MQSKSAREREREKIKAEASSRCFAGASFVNKCILWMFVGGIASYQVYFAKALEDHAHCQCADRWRWALGQASCCLCSGVQYDLGCAWSIVGFVW